MRPLGLNDEHKRLVPTMLLAEVSEDSKIVKVAAGGAHNMTVDKSGSMLAWGWGSSASCAWATPTTGCCAWATPTTGWCRRGPTD
jgi:alpha-tubulin suppressor-like RCC1 family protein